MKRRTTHSSRHLLKIFAATSIATAVLSLSVASIVRPVEAAPVDTSSCSVAKRFSNWGGFVSSGISFTDFASNWADIFTRNSCQRADIVAIQNAIDAAQAQLRGKIMSCQSTNIDALTRQINDLKFELEYVRNVIDTDNEKPLLEGSKAIIRSPERLGQLLSDTVVVKRGLVDGARFTTLFGQFQSKYASRLTTYTNCKDEDWEALNTSWDTFTNTWGGLTPAWDKLKKSTTTKFNNVTTPIRWSDYLSGILDVRLNNLTPQQTLGNIVNKLNGTLSTKSGTSVDFNSVLTTAQQDSARYLNDEDRARQRAYYEVLYKQSGDRAGSGMLSKLREMNLAIKETLPLMDDVRACTKTIADKECPGQ